MDQHPFKCLAMEGACDRKTDMTCLCTTCSRGGTRGCPQHVSVCVFVVVCFVVALLADDVIVVGIFLVCGLLYSNHGHIILLTS